MWKHGDPFRVTCPAADVAVDPIGDLLSFTRGKFEPAAKAVPAERRILL